ncbi:MAG TPA: hypothetical protein VLS89_12510 [Candidatus Nanopelagicales bacterium]|nr:hypothetical protein [Candidatus Nanopelagicales bacterium]
MRLRPRAALASITLVLSLLLPRAGWAQEAEERGGEESDHLVSPEGRRFRVRFDPASRIWLGVGGALLGDARRPAVEGPEITHGLAYRARYESGAGPARVTWQLDHRLLAGWIVPSAQPMAGVPSLDAVVYGLAGLRHDESPRIVLPLSPPVSVSFPFDVGFETELGRVWIPASPPPAAVEGGAPVPVVRVGVLRASAILDPWRSGEPGRSLEIGLGVRYDIDAFAGEAPRVIHRVAPMTAGSLRFRVQAGDGLTALDSRVEGVPHWTSEGAWQVMVMSAARLERTLLAVNDQPVSAVLEGGYRLLPPSPDAGVLHDLRVSLGVAFALQLR